MGGYVEGPNQQVVRGSPPPDNLPVDLDQMTKPQLLAYAEENQVDANETMTKAQIKAAIEA